MTLKGLGLFVTAVAAISLTCEQASAQNWRQQGSPRWQSGGTPRRAGHFDQRNHSAGVLAPAGSSSQVQLVSGLDDAPPPPEGEAGTAKNAPPAGGAPNGLGAPPSGAAPIVAGGGCCQNGESCYQCCEDACPCFWEHRCGGHFDYLFLKARNADVQYATPVNALGAVSVPIRQSEMIDFDYSSGYRFGATWALDSCSSVSFDYTYFQSHNTDSISLPGGTGFLRADTIHPNALPAPVAADSLFASAKYDVDYRFVDLSYSGVLWGGDCYVLNYVLGLRYGDIEQNFDAVYLITGRHQVQTDIDFEGIGPRIGLEGERLIGRGFLVYAKGAASFLAGESRSDYSHRAITAAAPLAVSGVNDDRVVTVLEMELGVGWQSKCGRARLLAGYMVNSWHNVLTTPDLIQAVQTNQLDQYGNADENIAFDGLSLRLEFRR